MPSPVASSYSFGMQIYTKILLGMAIGTVIGLCLGPKSTFLEHDLYRFSRCDAAKLTTEDGSETISFSVLGKGAGLPLDLKVEGPLERTPDGHGKVLVSLELTQQFALLDSEKKLSRQLGGIATGERARAWLIVPHSDKGLPTVVPVSAMGTTLIEMLRPVGDLFMRMIKMVIVPLVFASLLVGVAGLGDIRKLGRLGGRTLGLYVLTTAMAVTIGLTSANLIKPGGFMAEGDKAQLKSQFEDKAQDKADAAAQAPSTVDNLLSIVPENPIQALSQGDMLQIIFFAMMFGIALTMLGAGEAEIVVTFFDKIQQAMVMIIHMVMAVAPYGVAALLADVIGTSGWTVLQALLVYSLTVLVGLTIQGGVVYGGLIRVRGIPWGGFMRAIRPAQLLAFSTSSSSATLPVSMECAERSLGVSNSVSSFVLPLGSTVNMDGTALYQGVAAVFIAQVFGIDLSLMDQLTIVLTATMASIGAAGVPGAGMITLAMVLTAVGIPAAGVALILGMDRILDMFRTAVNVTGDLAVTSFMASLEGENVTPITDAQDQADPESGFEGRLEREEEPIEPVDDPLDHEERNPSSEG